MDLLERMRRARQSQVTLGPIRVTIQRPTDMDALEMGYDGTRAAVEGAAQFVVGWDGMNEVDLVPGGVAEIVPFDHDLFLEWILDQPELWEPLVIAVRDAYQSHRKKMETALKN